MSNKQATFPFVLITQWIRPQKASDALCMFCNQETITYRMDHFIDILRTHASGKVDMDASWRRGIKKQMRGIYEPEIYQLMCDECMWHFASIQLGSKRALCQLLTYAEMMKKQHHADLSHVLCCTVASLDDEGNMWAMNAPNTTIADVVEYIKKRG